jgi:hypothetical protein
MNYAGIGAKRLTSTLAKRCRILAKYLAKEGATLYTGATQGASQEFAEAALAQGGCVELVLPWRTYEIDWVQQIVDDYKNQIRARSIEINPAFHDHDKAAAASVEWYHPTPEKVRGTTLTLYARNYRIVIPDCPVNFVVAIPSSKKGGTMQGLRIAKAEGIPIIRLDKMSAKKAKRRVQLVLRRRKEVPTREDAVFNILPKASPSLLVVDAQKTMVANSFSKGGTYCLACGRKSIAYTRTLHAEMAYFLVRLADRYLRTRKWCDIKDLIPGGNKKSKSSTDGSYLVHWGFIKRLRGKVGKYKPTREGIHFAAGDTDALRSLYLYQNNIVGCSEERTDVHNALGDKFNLEKIFRRIDKRKMSYKEEE